MSYKRGIQRAKITGNRFRCTVVQDALLREIDLRLKDSAQ